MHTAANIAQQIKFNFVKKKRKQLKKNTPLSYWRPTFHYWNSTSLSGFIWEIWADSLNEVYTVKKKLKKFLQSRLVYLINFHHGLFLSEAIEYIDQNLTSTKAKPPTQLTRILMFQHPDSTTEDWKTKVLKTALLHQLLCYNTYFNISHTWLVFVTCQKIS